MNQDCARGMQYFVEFLLLNTLFCDDYKHNVFGKCILNVRTHATGHGYYCDIESAEMLLHFLFTRTGYILTQRPHTKSL